jgi:hypothetical protein
MIVVVGVARELAAVVTDPITFGAIVGPNVAGLAVMVLSTLVTVLKTPISTSAPCRMG